MDQALPELVVSLDLVQSPLAAILDSNLEIFDRIDANIVLPLAHVSLDFFHKNSLHW
jgi:hypothetical protein